MRIRTRLAIAAVTAASATAIAVPALAASPSASHTLHFTVVGIGRQAFTQAAQAEADKDVSAGKVIGYDVLSILRQNASVALSINHGFLYGHFTFASNGTFKGKVTGGTGRYGGATGTIAGHMLKGGKASVTVVYH